MTGLKLAHPDVTEAPSGCKRAGLQGAARGARGEEVGIHWGAGRGARRGDRVCRQGPQGWRGVGRGSTASIEGLPSTWRVKRLPHWRLRGCSPSEQKTGLRSRGLSRRPRHSSDPTRAAPLQASESPHRRFKVAAVRLQSLETVNKKVSTKTQMIGKQSRELEHRSQR